MCGLVGISSSNMMQKHRDAFLTLLYFSALRGKDATGIAAIHKDRSTEIHKLPIQAADFIENTARLNSLLSLTDTVWIGHTRARTIGENTKQNAHPFWVLNEQENCVLVGAHNGTITNKHSIEGHAKFGTDSEAVYNAIAKSSLKETVSKLEGAWALTYVDQILGKAVVLRNDKRTLYYCFEKDKKSIFWASEAWMLNVALSRHGIEIEDKEISLFDEDTIYSWEIPDKLNAPIALEIGEKGGLPGKKAEQNFHYHQHRHYGHQNTFSPWEEMEEREEEEKGRKTKTTSESSIQPQVSGTSQALTPTDKTSTSQSVNSSTSNQKKKEQKTKGATELRPYRGYRQSLLSLRELKEKLKDGCGWCELEEIHVNDRFAWIDDNTPVCSKCLDGIEEPTSYSRQSIHH